MKKTGRRIWVWIISGLALVFGVNSCDPSKLYGPPIETLYGPPPPELESDTLPE